MDCATYLRTLSYLVFAAALLACASVDARLPHAYVAATAQRAHSSTGAASSARHQRGTAQLSSFLHAASHRPGQEQLTHGRAASSTPYSGGITQRQLGSTSERNGRRKGATAAQIQTVQTLDFDKRWCAELRDASLLCVNMVPGSRICTINVNGTLACVSL